MSVGMPSGDGEPRPANVRVVELTRRLVEAVLVSTAADDAFDRAAELIRGAVDEMSSGSGDRSYTRVTEGAIAGPGLYAAITGLLHPFAPPIAIEIAPGDGHADVTGTVAYGFAYEGPPGSVHGGFIAAGFDEVLGIAQATAGMVRFTGQLSVTYRHPAPLRTELTYRARIERIEGRKATVAGTLHAGEVLCAEATALFIAPREGRFEAMVERRGEGTA